MTKTKNKFLLFALIGLLMIGMSSIPVKANEINGQSTVNEIEPTEETEQTNGPSSSGLGLGIGEQLQGTGEEGIITGDDVYSNSGQINNLDDLTQKVTKKTGEVSKAVQTILSSLCIVVFLVGAAKTLFGSIGGRGGAMGGILTMALTAVCYVIINYSSEILAWLQTWMLN